MPTINDILDRQPRSASITQRTLNTSAAAEPLENQARIINKEVEHLKTAQANDANVKRDNILTQATIRASQTQDLEEIDNIFDNAFEMVDAESANIADLNYRTKYQQDTQLQKNKMGLERDLIKRSRYIDLEKLKQGSLEDDTFNTGNITDATYDVVVKSLVDSANSRLSAGVYSKPEYQQKVKDIKTRAASTVVDELIADLNVAYESGNTTRVDNINQRLDVFVNGKTYKKNFGAAGVTETLTFIKNHKKQFEDNAKLSKTNRIKDAADYLVSTTDGDVAQIQAYTNRLRDTGDVESARLFKEHALSSLKTHQTLKSVNDKANLDAFTDDIYNTINESVSNNTPLPSFNSFISGANIDAKDVYDLRTVYDNVVKSRVTQGKPSTNPTELLTHQQDFIQYHSDLQQLRRNYNNDLPTNAIDYTLAQHVKKDDDDGSRYIDKDVLLDVMRRNGKRDSYPNVQLVLDDSPDKIPLAEARDVANQYGSKKFKQQGINLTEYYEKLIIHKKRGMAEVYKDSGLYEQTEELLMDIANADSTNADTIKKSTMYNMVEEVFASQGVNEEDFKDIISKTPQLLSQIKQRAMGVEGDRAIIDEEFIKNLLFNERTKELYHDLGEKYENSSFLIRDNAEYNPLLFYVSDKPELAKSLLEVGTDVNAPDINELNDRMLRMINNNIPNYLQDLYIKGYEDEVLDVIPRIQSGELSITEGKSAVAKAIQQSVSVTKQQAILREQEQQEEDAERAELHKAVGITTPTYGQSNDG